MWHVASQPQYKNQLRYARIAGGPKYKAMIVVEHLKTDFDRAFYLQNLLINLSTGGREDNDEYQQLRQYFIKEFHTDQLIPSWIRDNRDLPQFWQFIKNEFSTYADRRSFIWAEFSPLLKFLESTKEAPSDQNISEILKQFNSESIQRVWAKALERRQSDPEGAITIARTLLETICKHILDETGITYSNKEDLPQLYKLVSDKLRLSPSQHTEDIFKKIGSGSLR